MRRRSLLLGTAALAACGQTPPGTPPTDQGSLPSPTPTTAAATTPSSTAPASSAGTPAAPRTAPDGRPFLVKEVARIDNPWAMAFLPDGNLLITRRTGQLMHRNQSTGEMRQVQGAPVVVAAGQGGLGDIVLAPSFATDSAVYLTWAEAGQGGTGAVLARATLDLAGLRLRDLTVIWRQNPKVSGSGHFSHRIAISPDKQYLFLSSGDRQKMDPAQDLPVNLGKILRLTLDGKPAPGNPFADRGGVSAEIWSYGHRNPLGLAFDPQGNLWDTEMGPQGGDEVNLILQGKNYGWPKASNGSHYGGADIPDHRPGDGYEAPKVSWNPSISPAGLIVYTGDVFPQYKGDLFFGALSGQALIRVDVSGTDAKKGDEWKMGDRIREVEQGPDGTIWLLTDESGAKLLQLVAP